MCVCGGREFISGGPLVAVPLWAVLGLSTVLVMICRLKLVFVYRNGLFWGSVGIATVLSLMIYCALKPS